MRKHYNGNRQSSFSRCGEITVRGNKDQIASRYEALAIEAERDGDRAQAHVYFNHVEHYRKESHE